METNNIYRIFVIDDNEIDCLIAKVIIENNAPHLVSSFFSAQKALETLRSRTIHKLDKAPYFIFLDIDMPVKDGWGFLQEFQQVLNDASGVQPFVYILTASIDFRDSMKAKNHPLVEGIVVKPFTRFAFESIIQKHSINSLMQ